MGESYEQSRKSDVSGRAVLTRSELVYSSSPERSELRPGGTDRAAGTHRTGPSAPKQHCNGLHLSSTQSVCLWWKLQLPGLCGDWRHRKFSCKVESSLGTLLHDLSTASSDCGSACQIRCVWRCTHRIGRASCVVHCVGLVTRRRRGAAASAW